MQRESHRLTVDMSPEKDIDSLIETLVNIYPQSSSPTDNPWPWIAATAFSALNRPEYVSNVFEYAVKKLSTHEERLLLARKMRDSVFKAGIIAGYPKAINALVQLNTVMPEELKDKSALRETDISISELTQRGQAYFDNAYGTTAGPVGSLIRDAYSDLGFFTITLAYGFVYSHFGVLNQYETSYSMLAALIPIDVPRQIGWHFQTAVRNGATFDQVKAVREIVIKVSEFCGAHWEVPVPDVVKPE